MTEKKKSLDAADIEKLLKDVKPVPAREPKDAEYFNPWSMGKKRTPGSKRIYCNSLPDQLPEK